MADMQSPEVEMTLAHLF